MEDRREEARVVAAQPSDSQSLADIGEKVNAIIAAAEAAAEEIMQRAEGQAAKRIEELTREAAEARAEAEQYARDMREAADSYGTQHRRGAEEDARRVLSDAENQARERLEVARAKAEQMERDIGQRHAALKREARMLEERRQRVLESLRELSAQLQDALAEPRDTAAPEDALLDALDVERRR
jgi:hypothetical protein